MIFKEKKHHNKICYLFFSSALFLSGCQHAEPSQTHSSEKPSHLARLRGHLPHTDFVQQSIQYIQEGDLPRASTELNKALQGFSHQPYLHVLNGLIYEHMADLGFDGKLELARIAYEKALELDPANWHALSFMGRLELKQNRYDKAQEFLANALLLQPDDSETLHELAMASYYARDLEVARGSILKALKTDSAQPLVHRSAAVIFSATGEQELSQKHFKIFESAVGKEDSDVQYIQKRLEDWRLAHAHYRSNPSQQSGMAKGFHQTAAQQQTDEKPVSSATPPSDRAPSATPKGPKPVVIFDCYLLRVSEDNSTLKGRNVLESFLGGNGLILNPRSATYLQNKTLDLVTNTPTNTITQTFSRALTWGTIQYNLQIANASDSRVEVLGRPTLSAFLNRKATFNSGDTLKGGVPGTTSGGSLADVPTGVLIQVTPIQIDGDEVTLDIELEGSLIGPYNAGNSISNQLLTISKTKVTTTMRLNFGETGMLGGIYERIDKSKKAGFPILQDIPGLQYLFSQEDTESHRKSVLFLVTPRRVKMLKKQMTKHFSATERRKDKPSLQQLIKTGALWDGTNPPGLITILEGLGDIYYEYRMGDILPPFWGKTKKLDTQMAQIAAFLYY